MATLSIKKSTVLFFVLLSAFYGTAEQYFKDKSCGALYSEEVLVGDKFQLSDNDQSINLAEDYRTSISGWSKTSSFEVENGCSLEICSETYLKGSCLTFNNGSYQSLPSFNATKVVSVRCTCSTKCKLSDIFLKKTSCARAYLKSGCTTSNLPYFELKGENRLPVEFSGKVKALKLRKGCTLSANSSNNEESIYDRETIENFSSSIQSYSCICDDMKFEPKVKAPPHSSYPSLIEVPNNQDAIARKLTEPRYFNHPGLRSAFKSLKNKRSARNAYILLLGSVGGGKSSTIRMLLDNPRITTVGGRESTTLDIHEYRISVPIDEIGLQNSELRIIDTPGLGDSSGLKQDAKFLASLDTFLTNHSELKDRIPNAVLIFHRLTEVQNSKFPYMLRALNSFKNKITDENFSNVIFVFTHFCSTSNDTKISPDALLSQVKTVIDTNSVFPKPVLISVAENKGYKHNLQIINGDYKLPNNEYYPKSLVDKLELITSKGNDPIGYGVFRTAFRDPAEFKFASRTISLKGGPKADNYLQTLISVQNSTGVRASTDCNVSENTTANVEKSLTDKLMDLVLLERQHQELKLKVLELELQKVRLELNMCRLNSSSAHQE